MSTVYTVTGPRSLASDLSAVIERVKAARPALFQTPARITPIQNGFHLFACGSIFGVQVTASSFLRATLRCTVQDVASRADYRLCYALLRECAALRGVAITDEEKERLSPDDLDDASADEEAIFTLRRAVGMLADNSGKSSTGIFRLTAGPLTLEVSHERMKQILPSDDPPIELEEYLNSMAAAQVREIQSAK